MSYIKATDILPEEILNLIQQYVEGEYLYIPKKEGSRKSWGESTKSKKETWQRNLQIYTENKKGVSAKELSEMYYLSLKSIQRIILQVKREVES